MATAENQTINSHDIERRALSVPEQARTLHIVDDLTYQRGGQLLVTIKDIRKQINETFDPIVQKAFAAHKEAVSQKKKVEAPLAEAEAIIKPALARYNEEQERKAREEQRRLEEMARKRAEDEALAAAAHAEKEGNHVEAETILNTPVEVAPIIQTFSAAPKLAGVSFREVWTAQVTDMMALVKAVAEGKANVAFLQPDLVALRKQASSLKSAMNIPGVRAVKESVTSGRAGVA